MDDLAERLRQIENNGSPDLWNEITKRSAQSPAPERRSFGQHLAAGLVAALIAVAALAFLFSVFPSGKDLTPSGDTLPPLEIRVWWTTNPSDLHIAASYRGEEIDLDGIETPGPDLEYPEGPSVALPVGTPITVESPGGDTVSVFQLQHARGEFVVEQGSCIVPGSLKELPGPGPSAFFIYVEGREGAGGQGFQAETEGEPLDHESALDPDSEVDADVLGLAVCDMRSTPTVPTPTPADYLPLVFPFSGDGWTVRNFGVVEGGEATKAWASTVAIDDRDLGPRSPAIPVHTIESLPPGEVVIVALATPWGFDPSDGPYPPGSLVPLKLSDATIRGPEAEEPEGDFTIYDIQSGYTAVRVFFGATPTATELEAAQAELATLQVPPTCPIGYEISASPAEAEPGEAVTLTGPMPFQFEDGSFDEEGRTIAIAWWNADKKDWPSLSSFSTRSPSPVAAGPIVRLGQGGVGQCSFSITFTVPDVPPGDYPIVMIHEGPLPSPDGSAFLASLSVSVR